MKKVPEQASAVGFDKTRKVKIRATICRRSKRRALSKASDFKLRHRPVESAYVEVSSGTVDS